MPHAPRHCNERHLLDADSALYRFNFEPADKTIGPKDQKIGNAALMTERATVDQTLGIAGCVIDRREPIAIRERPREPAGNLPLYARFGVTQRQYPSRRGPSYPGMHSERASKQTR